MNLQVGVKLIIQNTDGEILVLKRQGYGDLDGSWDIPGGRINPEEDLLTGLKREVIEEIGATFTGSPKIIKAQDIFPTGKDLHVVRLTFLLNENVSDVILSDEHNEYIYLPPAELIDLPLEPLLREVMAELASQPLLTSDNLL